MEVSYSDDDNSINNEENLSHNLSAYTGVSTTFKIRSIQSTFINDTEKLLDIMRIIAKYNDFDILQTMVHNVRTLERGTSIVFVGDDMTITLRTIPENRYLTLHMHTTKVYDTYQSIFDIYDFLVEAFEADYDSRDINIFDHLI